MTRPTLHLVPADAWGSRAADAPYLPDAYANDGFVHCTDGEEEVVAVANRIYRDDPRPFLVLTLDLDATGSPWRFDDSDHRYPHVYGPIAASSVLAVRPMPRLRDGTFLAPPSS